MLGATGVVVDSSGGVIGTHIAAGQYAVDFGHDISACAFTATIGNPGIFLPTSGFITTADRILNVNAVFVNTQSIAGADADRNFVLTVVC